MARAFTNMAQIETDLTEAFITLRSHFDIPSGSRTDSAFVHIESFCAVAIRVMRKTNPSKIRDCARTEEIKARLDGRAVEDDQQ